MTNISRRQWLRTAGLTGAFSLLGGAGVLADTSSRALRESGAAPANASLVRLSSNENPYGPSEKVRQAMTNAFSEACRYPFGYSQEFMEALARKEGVTTDHLFISAGSTEGLRIAGMVFGMESGEIVAPDPTFLALLDYAEEFGAFIHKVPVDEELNHDLKAMDQRITNRTSMVYLCNPNNPTGTILPGRALRDFCESASKRTMVFVDEAYIDFITEPNYPSMVELVKEGHNVIVAKTFSKVYGLAGLRIGYLIGRPDIIRRLRAKTVAFTNTLALFAAKAAMEDKDFYQFSLQKNMEAKEMIYATLDDLNLKYHQTHTNFVFFHTGRPINGLIRDMQEQGVQIGRPFPPLTDWCRISTGTIEETKQFCNGLRKVFT